MTGHFLIKAYSRNFVNSDNNCAGRTTFHDDHPGQSTRHTIHNLSPFRPSAESCSE